MSSDSSLPSRAALGYDKPAQTTRPFHFACKGGPFNVAMLCVLDGKVQIPTGWLTLVNLQNNAMLPKLGRHFAEAAKHLLSFRDFREMKKCKTALGLNSCFMPGVGKHFL